jgi:3-deoxy-manno-octulosonate cytidylyltransferase (CMP-KDO synthetase)
MNNQKKIACIIPARLASSRFPKKILAPLHNKPLIEHVWNAARATELFSDVVLAIDSAETEQVIEKFKGRFYSTSSSHLSGTDRLIEVMRSGALDADIWVNWQCDEPFINQAMIKDLIHTCSLNDADVWTLRKKIEHYDEVVSSQFAKVVVDHNGYALYFSRSAIPHYRSDIHPDSSQHIYYKHVGLYAYTTEALMRIAEMKPCALELAEQLEQLRFLFYGLKIKVHETMYNVYGIDTPADLVRAEKIMTTLNI